MTAFSYTDTNIHHTNKTYLFLLHHRAVEHMGLVNSDSMNQSSQRYYSPEVLDLFPYLIKYYFRFFLNQKDRIKLLSSPMSFKSSNPASHNPNSPDKNNDFLNKELRFFTPLNKSRIVDLKEVFVAPPKPNQNKVQPNRNSDPLYKTDDPFSNLSPQYPAYEERQGNATAPSKMRNPNFSDYEKRFSTEHTPVQAKIDVQIDYNQLAQLTSLSDTSSILSKPSTILPSRYSMPEEYSYNYENIKQSSNPVILQKEVLANNLPSRYSMPEEYERPFSEIPRQNSNPIRSLRDTAYDYAPTRSSMPNQSSSFSQSFHIQQSIPQIINEIKEYSYEKSPSVGNQNGLNNSKGEERGGQIKWEIREFGMDEPKKVLSSRVKRNKDKNEEELKLYNSLHIPRKESDSSYRLFGRINTDDSMRLSMNSLDQSIPKDHRPLGKKNLIFPTKSESENIVKSNEGNWHGQTELIPPKLKSKENSRRRIFENKEKNIPVYEKTWEKGFDEKERAASDEIFVGKIDVKGTNNFKNI